MKFQHDIWGIALIAIGLFLGLSLATYNPLDPSLNSIGQGLKVANACGYVGSFLADGFFQLFGLSVWLIVAGVLRQAWEVFQGEGFSFKDQRWVWASLLVVTLSTLSAIYFPQTKLYHGQIYLGGLIGLGISTMLTKVFNLVGAQVLLWSLASLLVVFYSEKSIQELSQSARAVVVKFFAVHKSPFWKYLATFFVVKEKKSTKEVLKNKLFFKKKDENQDEKKTEPAEKKSLVQNFFPIDNNQKKESFEIENGMQNLKPLFIGEQLEIQLGDKTVDKSVEDVNESGRRKVVLKTKVMRRIENWELPKMSLMEDPPATRIRVDEKEIKRKAETLTDKLSQFSVTGEVVAAKPGPAVTLFEFKPSANVRVSKITELADDLSLALSSESLRIIAPIPGRDVVGIETSNAQRETVYLKDLLADDTFWKDDIKLPIALGKQANGEPKIVDLRKMPHLMVAGTTGSGKSVFVVSAITGLLFTHSPKTLRMILIDPKQVDLTVFEKIPHLAMPPVTDTRQAVNALKWAVREMEKRYRSMNKFSARGLEIYNETVSNLSKEQIEEHDKVNQELESSPGKRSEQYYFSQLPYIVIVVEEFGDLMSVDKVNVEAAVVRLAQMARACGIHLILAMQSPRKEVVTGLIKTNIPGRISFKVNSSMDSRIILDDTGAERLLAQGDMLYKSPGGSSLIRHHGPFLKDAEIAQIAKFWSSQAEPEYLTSAMKAMESANEMSSEDGAMGGEEESYDDRYDEILSWASEQKEISASLIQRRFSLGYPRAARIVETFEREGVVGPSNGSKPRQVLVSSYNHLVE